MTLDTQDNSWSALFGALAGRTRSKTISGDYTAPSMKGTSLESPQLHGSSLLSMSLSIGSMVRDDPRVVAALEEYLEALNTGRPLTRHDFLAQYPEIAGSLSQCLSGLEFIHVAGTQLAGLNPTSSLQATRCCFSEHPAR